MRTGLYNLAGLFGNRHIEQLVIPEIQRDYVWGESQVKHLLDSILGNFHAWRQVRESSSLKLAMAAPDGSSGGDSDELRSFRAEFVEFHARRVHAINVGFIYAYCDEDLPGQYFLIDGQQRLTTLYLALLATATRDEELKERFRARYCLNQGESEDPGVVPPTRLDYRLREHSSRFLHQWVRHLLQAGGPPTAAKEQSWYLQRLDKDPTVSNLLANYGTIGHLLDAGLADAKATCLYEYLEELVECWYFDTKESAQGEELYIYLNARGESIADNENIKASLLAGVGDPAAKEHWGRKWEEWQDYFWLKRDFPVSKHGGNPNADRGFNSFLSCIENLEKLRVASRTTSLSVIEQYIGALKWLDDNRAAFKLPYAYAGWVDEWFTEMWTLLNQAKSVNWSADVRDHNEGTNQNRMVLVWGSLICVLLELEQAGGDFKTLDCPRVFRAIRVIFLRYHNKNRSVVFLEGAVKSLLAGSDPGSPALAYANAEEQSKWSYLSGRPEAERLRLEAVIWKIEDHPLNLDGSDLGAVNLSHLVDLGPGVELQQLEGIRDAFYQLLPPDDEKSTATRKKLAAVLLHYGIYWDRISPWYLENYELGDWRKTIRGAGSEERRSKGKRSVFREFFDEYLQKGQSLVDFAAAKRRTAQVSPGSGVDLRRALIWYSEKLGSRFLGKGMHVELDPGHYEMDAYFPDLFTIWNTRGDFRSSSGYAKMSDQGIDPC